MENKKFYVNFNFVDYDITSTENIDTDRLDIEQFDKEFDTLEQAQNFIDLAMQDQIDTQYIIDKDMQEKHTYTTKNNEIWQDNKTIYGWYTITNEKK